MLKASLSYLQRTTRYVSLARTNGHYTLRIYEKMLLDESNGASRKDGGERQEICLESEDNLLCSSNQLPNIHGLCSQMIEWVALYGVYVLVWFIGRLSNLELITRSRVMEHPYYNRVEELGGIKGSGCSEAPLLHKGGIGGKIPLTTLG